MKKIVEYIKHNVREKKKNYRIHTSIHLAVIHSLPENIDVEYVISEIENSIPRHFFNNIDAIYIAHIKEFDERDINALHRDGAIYITNKQDDHEDMIDDIVHEIAHSVEHMYHDIVYDELSLEREFLGKRRRLFDLLKNSNIEAEKEDFMKSDFSFEFDRYLHQTLGYEKLEGYTIGLFSSPYSATSLSEYFATGFEEYFIGDRNYLRSISPVLFKAIEVIENLEE